MTSLHLRRLHLCAHPVNISPTSCSPHPVEHDFSGLSPHSELLVTADSPERQRNATGVEAAERKHFQLLRKHGQAEKIADENSCSLQAESSLGSKAVKARISIQSAKHETRQSQRHDGDSKSGSFVKSETKSAQSALNRNDNIDWILASAIHGTAENFPVHTEPVFDTLTGCPTCSSWNRKTILPVETEVSLDSHTVFSASQSQTQGCYAEVSPDESSSPTFNTENSKRPLKLYPDTEPYSNPNTDEAYCERNTACERCASSCRSSAKCSPASHSPDESWCLSERGSAQVQQDQSISTWTYCGSACSNHSEEFADFQVPKTGVSATDETDTICLQNLLTTFSDNSVSLEEPSGDDENNRRRTTADYKAEARCYGFQRRQQIAAESQCPDNESSGASVTRKDLEQLRQLLMRLNMNLGDVAGVSRSDCSNEKADAWMSCDLLPPQATPECKDSSTSPPAQTPDAVSPKKGSHGRASPPSDVAGAPCGIEGGDGVALIPGLVPGETGSEDAEGESLPVEGVPAASGREHEEAWGSVGEVGTRAGDGVALIPGPVPRETGSEDAEGKSLPVEGARGSVREVGTQAGDGVALIPGETGSEAAEGESLPVEGAPAAIGGEREEVGTQAGDSGALIPGPVPGETGSEAAEEESLPVEGAPVAIGGEREEVGTKAGEAAAARQEAACSPVRPLCSDASVQADPPPAAALEDAAVSAPGPEVADVSQQTSPVGRGLRTAGEWLFDASSPSPPALSRVCSGSGSSVGGDEEEEQWLAERCLADPPSTASASRGDAGRGRWERRLSSWSWSSSRGAEGPSSVAEGPLPPRAPRPVSCWPFRRQNARAGG